MRKRLGIVIGSVLLAALLNFFCFLPELRLHTAMSPYTEAVNGELPADLRLTICYMDPTALTPIPVTPERLLSSYADKTITVQAEELEKHRDLLQALNPAELMPIKREAPVNIRIYCIFETDSGKLLDVAMSSIYDDPVVNGMKVEGSDLFYELIDPFLTDEDRSVLHRRF